MKFFKNLFNSFLKIFGFRIENINPRVRNNSFNEIIKVLLNESSWTSRNINKENPVINKEFIFFDVGAHLGQTIKRFRNISSKVLTYSFEPIKDHYELLVKNFGSDKKIKIFNLALSDKSVQRLIFKHPYGSSSFFDLDKDMSSVKRRFIGEKVSREENVKTQTLDDFCEKNKISKIDFLKIDTQGHEYEVLLGAQNLLKKNNVKIIEFEYIIGTTYLNRNQNFHLIFKLLLEHNYFQIAIDRPGNFIADDEYQINTIFVNGLIYNKIINYHKLKTGKEIFQIGKKLIVK